MPLGTRSAEAALASTALDAALGGRYGNVPPAARARNIWTDRDARTHVVLWHLSRAEALYAEAEEPFVRATVLTAIEDAIWTRHKGDRSLAKRGITISTISAAQAFDVSFEELTRIAGELA